MTSIRPQPGPQEAFLASPADIAIAGGAAGGGKTWALLLEPLRHINNKEFGAVIFRRTHPQITNEGALWDEAAKLYPEVGGVPIGGNTLSYSFPSGMRVKFAHMQYAKDRFSWKGAQVPLVGFDQLEDFEESQFWYLLSRSRSATVGIQPYMRATCNPVPSEDPVGGWLNRLISWWIDPETGYAIPERSGRLRWFVRISEQLYFADSPEGLRRDVRKEMPSIKDTAIRPKSLTFIPALLEDNPKLEENDPGYRANLMAMSNVERERLLMGNWKVKPEAGKVFNRSSFGVLTAIPADVVQWVRYWDKAGTADDENPGSARSAGVLIGKRKNGRFIVASSICDRWDAVNRERVILQAAHADRATHGNVATWTEQEPGSGGKESAQSTVRNLAGFNVRTETATGKKIVRAQPFAAQVQAGNVDILAGDWNEDYLSEMHNFDGVKGLMDQVDGSSGAFNKLTSGRSAGDPIVY